MLFQVNKFKFSIFTCVFLIKISNKYLFLDSSYFFFTEIDPLFLIIPRLVDVRGNINFKSFEKVKNSDEISF